MGAKAEEQYAQTKEKGREKLVTMDDKGGTRGRPGGQEVFDPITKQTISTHDATHEDLTKAFEETTSVVPPKSAKSTSSLQVEPSGSGNPAVPPISTGNVLYYPHPPIDWKHHHQKSRAIIARYIAFAALVSFAGSYFPKVRPLLVGIGIATAGVYALRMLDASFSDVEWDTERQRGLEATKQKMPESAEWLNALVEKIWPLIDNQLFMSITDQLEDIMQQTVPGMIESVKIVELHQGKVPVRLLSMRTLPNEEMLEIARENKDRDSDLAKEERQQVGSFVNVECSFAYRSKPTHLTLKSKTSNARLLIEFFIGAESLSAIKFPVFVGLEGIVGTMRARIHLTPDPPFAKEVTVSLMGLPRVEISAIPLWQKLPNVMGLPLISGFVEKSIDKAMREYCAPRSLSLDVTELLMGDGFKKSLDTFGVLVVNIHRAEGLAKSDRRGSSDPYVVLQFSRLARPLFSTRIIVDDLNPHFEETAIILITDDAIKADERLSVQLWDSDRFSADDQLGHVDVPLRHLIKNKGQADEREDSLTGDTPDSSQPGKLHWDVTFHGLRPLDRSRATQGHDPRIPDALRQQEPELDQHGKVHENPMLPTPPVMFVPPDPDYPSGILAIGIIQVADLGFKQQKGTFGNREGIVVGQDVETDQTQDEHDEDVPSSYVNIHLNDVPIYRTRVKPLASNAFFNAGTERFIPDWRTCQIMLVVRQKGLREQDALLGVVPLRLADMVKNASCLSQWMPISGGIGYGKIRVGILFRSIDVKLEKPLLSYDVGTLRFLSDVKIYDIDPSVRDELKNAECRLETLGGRHVIKRGSGSSESSALVWSTEVEMPPLRMPLKRRDASSLLIELRTGTLKKKRFAVARQWIRTLVADEVITLKLPLYISSNFEGFIQNHVDEQHIKRWDLKQVGTVELKIEFKQGLGPAHRHSKMMRQPEQRALMEAWDAAINAGLRVRSVDEDLAEDFRPDEEEDGDSSSDSDDDERQDGLLSPSKKSGRGRSSSQGSAASDASRVSDKVMRQMHKERTSASRKAQQTGLYSHKSVRSMSWMAQGVKKRASKLAHALEHNSRSPDAMEQEGAIRGTLHVDG